jgi:hypothetical protein
VLQTEIEKSNSRSLRTELETRGSGGKVERKKTQGSRHISLRHNVKETNEDDRNR